MALYLIGDVQGCDAALQDLLDTIDFSPSRDALYVLGDLVNRGPDSSGVLRRLMAYGDAAHCLLGNHDLHLLALAQGVRKPNRKDTLACVLDAPDRPALLHWLRHQKMAMLLHRGDTPLLMVHAGVLPGWTASQTIALAHEVEAAVKGPRSAEFFTAMYGNRPNQWSETLTGMDRLRVIVNALTRLRFCTPEGEMEFESKEGAGGAPQGYVPWFDVASRKTSRIDVAFGHWSTMGWLARHDVISMDTGCVWGGSLSALRFNLRDTTQELIQVACAMSQRPG